MFGQAHSNEITPSPSFDEYYRPAAKLFRAPRKRSASNAPIVTIYEGRSPAVFNIAQLS
jgi:hypothetical protein